MSFRGKKADFFTEDSGENRAFAAVVGAGRRAVRIQERNPSGLDFGKGEGCADCCFETASFRMRTGWVIGVARASVGEQFDVGLDSAFRGVFRRFENETSGAFAEVEPFAVTVEWTAGFRRGDAECVEAGDGDAVEFTPTTSTRSQRPAESQSWAIPAASVPEAQALETVNAGPVRLY